MTNQPDESHPMRERVDKAISWFTQTDEPDAVDETGDPATDAPRRGVDEPAVAANEPAATVDEPTVAANEPAATVDEPAVAANEPAATVDEPAVAANEPATTVEEPATGVREPAAVEPSATPDTRVSETSGTVAEPDRVPVASGTVAEPDRVPVAGETVAAPDERVPETGATVAAPVLAGGALAAGAVAEHERAAERERAMDEEAVNERGAESVEPAAAVEETHVHHHEPPASWAEVHPSSRHLPPDGAIDSEAETTGTQRSLYRDEAPTVAMPAAAAAAAAAGAAAATAGRGEPTAVMDATEFARLRREERAARDRQLGKVIAAPEDADEPVPARYTTPTTYRALPSFGFLVFRLIIAAVVGIRAWQHVTHLSATRATWAATVMPSPTTVAYAQIGLEIAIAIMLLLGLGTRIAGLLLLVLSVVSLAFVQWGAVNPFQPGAIDFIGVVDVLLAGAGLLFATTGGGRAAFDGAIHAGRIRRKNDKLFA